MDVFVKGVFVVKDDIVVLCEGGVDGVVENVFKKCMEEVG